MSVCSDLADAMDEVTTQWDGCTFDGDVKGDDGHEDGTSESDDADDADD